MIRYSGVFSEKGHERDFPLYGCAPTQIFEQGQGYILYAVFCVQPVFNSSASEETAVMEWVEMQYCLNMKMTSRIVRHL